MRYRKGIGPVVASALLLVVAVIAVVGFQSWFNDYSSSTFTNVETQSSIDSTLRVEGLIGDILYLKSGGDVDLSLLKVSDSSGNEMCSFSGSTNVSGIGLVGWWTFDEIINNSGTLVLPDYSGLANDGILYDGNISNSDGNTTPQLVKSKLGNALEFDGVDDYVDLGPFSMPLNNLTILYFGKMNIIKNSHQTLIWQKDDLTSGFGFKVANNENIRFTLQNKTNSWYSTYSSNFNLNNFLTIGNFNGTHNNLYFNNILEESLTLSGPLFYNLSGNNLLLSKYRDGSFQAMNGQIDEIRIYNRTLSNEEIKTLYWYSIKPQQIGINQIDLSSCNLNNGEVYNVVAFTNNNKVEHTLIVK